MHQAAGRVAGRKSDHNRLTVPSQRRMGFADPDNQLALRLYGEVWAALAQPALAQPVVNGVAMVKKTQVARLSAGGIELHKAVGRHRHMFAPPQQRALVIPAASTHLAVSYRPG